MRKWTLRQQAWRLAALLSGTTLFLEGCDPTLRATVEDGIINTSSAFVGSFLRAFIEAASEAAAAA